MQFIIKTIVPENDEQDFERCRSEVHLLYSIESEHVIKPIEYYEETLKNGNKSYMVVFDHMECGSFDKIAKVDKLVNFKNE